MKTRRQFLVRTSLAVAGTALVPTTLLTPEFGASAAIGSGRDLNYSTFARLLQTAFQVRNQRHGLLNLRLHHVQLNASNGGECFTLTLRGPADQVLRQATYAFEHEQLGAFQMFIVPGEPVPSGHQYHATFNRCA